MFVEGLAKRAEALKRGRIDPREDNMLKITAEGRKAALDLRLMKLELPDDPQSKVNLAVEKIEQIWAATKDDRLTQLVFCDLSTPQDKGFSVYRDMADKLKRLTRLRSAPAEEQSSPFASRGSDVDRTARKLARGFDAPAGHERRQISHRTGQANFGQSRRCR